MEKQSNLWFWMLLALFIFLLYCLSTDRLYCATPVEGADQAVGQEPPVSGVSSPAPEAGGRTCAPAVHGSGHRCLPENVGSTGLPTYKCATQIEVESDGLVQHAVPDRFPSLYHHGLTQG